MLFLLSQHFFATLHAHNLLTVSQDSKPIHISRVRNEDFTLKQTPHKNMQMEVNDVIFKMADFANFALKRLKSRDGSCNHDKLYHYFHPKITIYSMV